MARRRSRSSSICGWRLRTGGVARTSPQVPLFCSGVSFSSGMASSSWNRWRRRWKSRSCAAVARQHRPRVDVDALDVARLQPLADEVLDQRLGARVGQHPLHLRVEVLAQLAALGEPEQLVVRHRGPEEIGEPRGQRVFVDERMTFRRTAPAPSPRRGTETAATPAPAPSPARCRPRSVCPAACKSLSAMRDQPSTVRSSTGRRKALRRETAQNLARILRGAPRRLRRTSLREEQVEVLRPHPMLLFDRPLRLAPR